MNGQMIASGFSWKTLIQSMTPHPTSITLPSHVHLLHLGSGRVMVQSSHREPR